MFNEDLANELLLFLRQSCLLFLVQVSDEVDAVAVLRPGDDHDQLLQTPRDVVSVRELCVLTHSDLLRLVEAQLLICSHGAVTRIPVPISAIQQVDVVPQGPPHTGALPVKEGSRHEVEQVCVTLKLIADLFSRQLRARLVQTAVMVLCLLELFEQFAHSIQQLQSLAPGNGSLRNLVRPLLRQCLDVRNIRALLIQIDEERAQVG